MGEVVTEEGVLPTNDVGMMPARRLKKDKLAAKKSAKKWIWAPFSSSARSDDLQLYHWQKADVEYADYPYARFNVGLQRVTYTPHEYDRCLRDAGWTRADTDHLLQLCHQFELRWPVIADRYAPLPPRPLEQLQARYYAVAHALRDARGDGEEEAEAAPLRGSPLVRGDADARVGISLRSRDYDVAYEEKRRRQLHVSFCRSRAEEAEERALRDELKAVELESRRLKKSAKGERADSAPGGVAALAAGLPPPPQPLPRRPQPGVPFLQSHRLRVPDGAAAGLSRGMLAKLALVLGELGVPEKPTPTKLVADAYDTLRRDVVTLLSLQKLACKKEAELRQLRRHEQQRAADKKTDAKAPTSEAKKAPPPQPQGQQQQLQQQKRKAPPPPGAADAASMQAAAIAAPGAPAPPAGQKRARK
ncbi:hypothetical protein M885DRAFT_551176 [Pelagophyceae sp. CCMP2097]|nr:hypothetical protein M885DRAFT_551176 [Pelagophyceae sp. CCMP2097]